MSTPEPTPGTPQAPAPAAAPAAPPVVPPGATVAPPAGQEPTTPATPPAAGEGQGNPTERRNDMHLLPEWAQSMISRLNRENAARRDALAQVTRAINPDSPDDKVDAKDLTDRLAAQQRENIVLRTASGHGADPNALLDSVSFLGAINGIDPAGEGASDLITAAITAAVARDPKLAATPPAPAKAGTGPHGGGHQAEPPKTLEQAIAARMGA